jgi:hypothetical protein
MKRVALFIPQGLLDGLDTLKEAHGTPTAESIRRAIAAYLAGMGVEPTQKGGSRPKKLQERKRTAAVLAVRRRS